MPNYSFSLKLGTKSNESRGKTPQWPSKTLSSSVFVGYLPSFAQPLEVEDAFKIT